MTYNPADYAAVLNEAKDQSKEELESYYANDKSKRDFSICEIILMTIGIVFIVFVVGYLGYNIGENNVKTELSDKILIIEEGICTHLEDYKSPNFFEMDNYQSKYYKNRIICD